MEIGILNRRLGDHDGWKRRSSAASFSIYLRYSFSVVAPMQCSSPRASIGLSRLPASMLPSVLPAPTMVCGSSMNRMMRPSLALMSFRTAFQALLKLAAEFCAGNQRAHIQREDGAVFQAVRHVAANNALRKPSAMAVLPTPGSPISTGLFFDLRKEYGWRFEFRYRGRSQDRACLSGKLDQILTVFFQRVIRRFRSSLVTRARCRERPAALPEISAW